MYLHNKYTITNYNIIEQAQSRTLDCYTENHHIIPKSLGGSNDSDNLVALTAREHFLCHWLLTKMTEGMDKAKMWKALHMMCNINEHQERYIVPSRLYEVIRIKAAKAHSKRLKGRFTGEDNPFYGKTHSDDTKRKISEKNKGKEHSNPLKGGKITGEWLENIKKSRASDDFKSQVSARHKGKTLTAEHKAALVNSRKGKPMSQEHKDKIRAAHLARRNKPINT